MMTDDDLWAKDGEESGWLLPAPAPAWKRLPVIRLIRAWVASARVERHYAMFGAFGMARSGYDAWVIYAIQRGWC